MAKGNCGMEHGGEAAILSLKEKGFSTKGVWKWPRLGADPGGLAVHILSTLMLGLLHILIFSQ